MQLMLFCERIAVPHCSSLAESTRVEVVKLLAKLLLSVEIASEETTPIRKQTSRSASRKEIERIPLNGNL